MASSSANITWQKLVPELTVSEFDKSLDVYTRILGFEVLFSRDKFVYLELEEIQFMLQAPEQDSWQTAALEQPYGRGINFQIELSNVTPVYERLQLESYPLFRDIEESWYRTGDILSGQREFLIHDPDGYLLRFCQPLGERPLEE